MLLSDYLNDLSAGPLSGINLGNNDETGLTPYNRNKIVNYINTGLVDIYTRFPIKSREVIIRQYTAISMYHLSRKYAQTNTESDVPYKYIEDTTAAPFTDRVLKIDRVFSGDGCEHSINKDNDCNSVFTPSVDVLQIPFSEHPNITSVIYRAAPDRLEANCDTEQEIELPMALINALTYYVVGKVYGEKQDQISMAKSSENLARYVESCRLVEQQGMTVSDNTDNLRLVRNDWV